MDSFISWLGGKRLMRKEIIKRIPSHKCYVEVFGGAAWVLFGKERTPGILEVYNDINNELVNLFRQVKYHNSALIEELSWLLTSREIFKQYKSAKGFTEIQRAARFWYVIVFSFGSLGGHFESGSAKSRANKSIINSLANFQQAKKRLDKVVIENLSFDECISRFDSPDTFFYIDPPYVTGHDYSHFGYKFTIDDHKKLASLLKKVKGKWLLSYGDHPLVRELYQDYKIEEFFRKAGPNNKCPVNRRFKELLIRNYELEDKTS